MFIWVSSGFSPPMNTATSSWSVLPQKNKRKNMKLWFKRYYGKQQHVFLRDTWVLFSKNYFCFWSESRGLRHAFYSCFNRPWMGCCLLFRATEEMPPTVQRYLVRNIYSSRLETVTALQIKTCIPKHYFAPILWSLVRSHLKISVSYLIKDDLHT